MQRQRIDNYRRLIAAALRVDIESVIESEDVIDVVNDALHELALRGKTAAKREKYQRRIAYLRSRFGLMDDNRPSTYQEMADVCLVSTSAIKRIVEDGLREMRMPWSCLYKRRDSLLK